MSMGLMAAALRNFPSARMHVVGITGTNGKTTTAHLMAEILRSHGWKTEVIGTLTGSRTTPESTDLQRLLSEFEGNGVKAVVMEVKYEFEDSPFWDSIGQHFQYRLGKNSKYVNGVALCGIM